MIWLIIQGITLVATFLLSLVACMVGATGSFGIISAQTHAKMIIAGFLMILFPIFSAIIGVVYLFVAASYSQLTLLHLLYLPIALLGMIAIKQFIYQIQENNKTKNRMETNRKIKEWLEQFSFVDNRDVHQNIYHFRGIYGGSLSIRTVQEHVQELESKRHELPESVELSISVRPKEEQDWYDLVRSWVQKVNKIGDMSIEDYTHYNSDSTKHQGNIYIVAEPKYFNQIEELSKELPTNIHLTLCKDRHIIHSLWSLMKNNSSYLEENHKGEYLILKTN